MKPLSVLLFIFFLIGCESKQNEMKKIIFLHHSTGQNIWLGNTHPYVNRFIKKSDVRTFFNRYNRKNNTNYFITDRFFPKAEPYGWKNYPYDYYNIWVKNAGDSLYKGEQTLEILTKEFDIIIFKHCFPVSNIQDDTGMPDINSEEKRLENYILQYNALKAKMHEFPDKKFIVWTPAVHVKNLLSQVEAERTREFYEWVKNVWDEKGDNIFVFDFYNYETEGELFLQDKYAYSPDNSHPNKQFSARIAPLFAQFIVDVEEGVCE